MSPRENRSMTIREIGRIIAGGYSDHQDVRKSTMNRIRDLVRHKNEGIPYKPENKRKVRNFDRKYKDANLPKLLEEMFASKKLTQAECDYLLKALELANKASSLESSHKGSLKTFVASEPVWQKFLSHIPGIGEVLAAKLIAKLADCENYKRISSLWRHAGLHLVCPYCTEKVDGKVFSLVVNSEGKCPQCGSVGVGPKKKRGQKIDYDNKLRALTWNIAKSLVKQRSPIYYDIYNKEKNHQRQRRFAKGELREKYGDPYREEDTILKLGHADSRALRKLAKMFLQHYWVVSRSLADLPVSEPYVKDKLGHQNIITWQNVLKANGVNEF